MSFLAERDMARRALEYRGPKPYPELPPVASRIRAARERLGVSMLEFASRWSAEPWAYRDLEFADHELFTTVDLGDLPRLASALELPLMVLLFGEAPMRPLSSVSYNDVARAIGRRLSDDGLTIEQLSEIAGWELQPIVDESGTLATFNLQGVFDVCQTVGLDWVGLVDAVERGVA